MVRKRFLRQASLLLGSTLGLGCNDYVMEYGTPHASFDLDGTVVDDQTGEPIPDIEVAFDGNTTTTGAEGAWSLSVESGFACGPDCTVSARDVDGDDNGSYTETTTEFTATQTAQGDGDWDDGAWEAHDVEIALKPQQGDTGLL